MRLRHIVEKRAEHPRAACFVAITKAKITPSVVGSRVDLVRCMPAVEYKKVFDHGKGGAANSHEFPLNSVSAGFGKIRLCCLLTS